MPDPTLALRPASLAAAEQEVADLEARLHAAKLRRAALAGAGPDDSDGSPDAADPEALSTAEHFFLLLSDSALPLGSFAFSSGLESFLAHSKTAPSPSTSATASASAFAAFLPLSVASYASASLPFMLAAHDAATAARATGVPLAPVLARLDDTYDATIICTVGRRASVAQGRALLSVWERAFAPALVPARSPADADAPGDPLRPFAQLVKRSGGGAGSGALATPEANLSASLAADPPAASAHMPPLFGAVAGLAGLGRRPTADVFVFAHVKGLVSAAVRSNLMGPYQAQRLLASAAVRRLVAEAVARAWAVPVEEAGQTAPVVDLWMGRHEMLYSRIFNS